MELAAGRSVVSSKETSSGRSGAGAGGPDSGRGGSGRDRESDYRSSVADDGRKPRERDYSRDGAGGVGRGRDRDRDKKEWGASKGGEKPLQRWRGAVESGRSGSSRLYVGGDIRDKGYRYHSHHRDRSRSPPPSDRNKRPRVSGNSPGIGVDGESGIVSSSSRRDHRDRDPARDKDRSRVRDNDRTRSSARSGGGREGGGGGGSGVRSNSEYQRGSGGSRSGGSGMRGDASSTSAGGSAAGIGRRLGNLPEEFVNGERNGGNSSGGGSSGSGSSSSGSRSGSRSRSNNRGDDAGASGVGSGKLYDTDHLGKDRFLYSSPDGDGSGGAGRGVAVSDLKAFAASGDAEEEGEVLLTGSAASSSVPTATAAAAARSPSSRVHRRDRTNGYSGGGGRSGKDDDGEGYNTSRRAKSSPRDRRGVVGERGGSGDEGVGGAGGGGVVERPKKAGKDRWADSDSEDEDDEGPKKRDEKISAESRNAKGKGKANGVSGAGTGDGEADRGPRSHDAENIKKNGSCRGGEGGGEDGSEGDVAKGAAGGIEGSNLSAVKELQQAMAGGKSSTSRVSGLEGSPKKTEVGERGVAGDAEAGDVSKPSQARRLPLPLTVFTRDQVDEDPYNPLLYGCRSVENYNKIGFVDEGAYGKVYCALNKNTGQVVALKQVKLTRDNGREGFPITALRETNVLLSLHSPNIVRVLEMVVGSSQDKVFMVMEYFDHDLKSVMRHLREEKRCFTLGQVKSLMLQLLRAVEYMHRHWYIHRDLKTSNLLYNHQGKLAVCDFGLARKYEEPIRAYTSNVVTQWYRCPELLLGEKTYSTGVDTWSVGCIFGEVVKGSPMFQGKSEIDQLAKIFGVLGCPTEERWPGWSKLPVARKLDWRQGRENQLRATFPTTGFSSQASISEQGLELMNGLLALDPSKRTSADDALKHWWFTTEKPAPTPVGGMPQVDSRLDDKINKALAEWSMRKGAH